MFNPMTSTEMVTAIGRAVREAGRSREPASDFSRGQLMSVYSASRHLAVELAEYPAELRGFALVAAGELRGAAALDRGEELAAIAAELEQTEDPQRIGDLLSAALAQLRGDPTAPAAELRGRLQTRLRRLADREVELLADVIEARRE
jgi:hypothetical protein